MKKVITITLLFIVLAISTLLWWNNGINAVNPNDKTQKIFVVAKGQGVRDIAKSLKEEGFIKDPVVFFLVVKRLGLDGKIQAGDFRLSPSQTAEEIARELTHGTLDIWVTVPEGYRSGEIADVLEKNMPTYKPPWRNVLNQHEGYLFPDTYLIPKDADAQLVVSLMKQNFEKKFETIANTAKLSKEEIVIIASLIEREAKFAQDRPLVASVILNRINIGMKLDIDATVQYALGYQGKEKRWWKRNLTKDDLAIDSPYNTYTHAGLPPTPIANPGLAALKAVISPTQTNYLYYVSDKTGHNHYAQTLEEHQANIKKYGL